MNARTLVQQGRSVAGRLSWGLADQAVSSLTNFAVGAMVARSIGLAEFGAFTLAWTTSALALNVSRGLATDPLVVRFSASPVAAWRRAVACTSATAVLVGLVAGACCLLAGLLVPGAVGNAFVALGLVLPFLLLQDSWRFAFFAAGRGRDAFVNDVIWGLALIPALFIAAQNGGVFGFVLAWGLSAGVAAGCGFLQERVALSFPGAFVWFRQQRDLGLRYLVENVTLSGGVQLRTYALGAIAGLADVGALRGAQLLLGPLLAVLMGIGVVAVPEAARFLAQSPRRLSQFCLALGTAQSMCAVAWGVGVLFVLPHAVGRFFLGTVWEPAYALVLPVVLAVVVGTFAAGANTGLRALGDARRSLRCQVIETSTFLVASVIGAFLAGALGSSWGAVLASVLAATVWWTQLRVALRAGRRAPVPVTE